MKLRSMSVTALAAVFATLSAGVAVAATPKGGPTGNPATIAYYTTVTNRFNDQPSNVVVAGGAFWLGYSSPTDFTLSWDRPHRTASYQQPVDETIVSGVAHQKVVWEEITWSYACPPGHVCVSTLPPLRFFITKHAGYWEILSGPNHTASCWDTATASNAWINQDFNSTGTKPWYVGSSPFATSPNYLPMVVQGHEVKVTSTYKFKYGAAVREVDTIDASTHLFTATTVKVSPYGRYLGYSLKETISVPKKAAKPPKVHVC